MPARLRRSAKVRLLWEMLRRPARQADEAKVGLTSLAEVPKRLPGDRRCVAWTRSGRRCRGRIRPGSEFCAFHDPSITAEKRRANAIKAAQTRRTRASLPKGYPRRLTTPEAARAALERLYAEIRAGVVTPEQARLLLEVLQRLLDRPAVRSGNMVQPSTHASAAQASYEPSGEVKPATWQLDLFTAPSQVDVAVRRAAHN